jgi:amidohydrolase
MNYKPLGLVACLAALAASEGAKAQQSPSLQAIDARIDALYPQVVAWRRDIHQHPELGNREFRTSKVVAAELKALGLEVRTGVAHTGVVAILRGGKPGAVVALRSELDALPVQEETGLPFASTVRGEYNGQSVPVAHVCGHDSHMAMLLGAAAVLAGMRDQIQGTVVFLFQPAEEGSPRDEEGGAPLMIKEGALGDPKPGAVFALHVAPGPVGHIMTRKGPFFAGSDTLHIVLHGRGTHGAEPWNGVDVISLSATVVQALNAIASRQVDVTESPTVITIGSLQAGVRFNVIPEEARLEGTIRTYGAERRADVIERITRTVKDLADSYGATADVSFDGTNPSTDNDAALLDEIAPALQEAAGPAGADLQYKAVTTAEDFSFYGRVEPAVFIRLGATPNFTDYKSAPTNHSPRFTVDESVMRTGVRTHVLVALKYLADHAPGAASPSLR